MNLPVSSHRTITVASSAAILLDEVSAALNCGVVG